MARIVVCITGASGVVLAHKAVGLLCAKGHRVDLVISQEACLTIMHEMGKAVSSPKKFVESFDPTFQKNIVLHAIKDFNADIASGSAHFDACLVIPCSMATLAAIATGLSDNLIRRVADVCLKEKRTLVVCPREAPFHQIHLENMLKLSRLGAVIFVPQPAWYLMPKSIDDVENAIVMRVLDQIGITSDIAPRWQGVSTP
jgi:4-hydroxy-3-polyprenylbenzoate decarboxylase